MFCSVVSEVQDSHPPKKQATAFTSRFLQSLHVVHVSVLLSLLLH